MESNSLNGVFSDSHFVNVSKLYYLDLSDNSNLEIYSKLGPLFSIALHKVVIMHVRYISQMVVYAKYICFS